MACVAARHSEDRIMRIVLAALFCALISSTVPAAELPSEVLDSWPQWRGPLANGTAPHGDPPIHWDQKTGIRWKTALPGRGASTPIVWGDQVFVLTVADTGRKAEAAAQPKNEPRFKK